MVLSQKFFFAGVSYISSHYVNPLLTLPLNVAKASGPDNISQRFLKECAHSLARPFAMLFQRSMNDGVFSYYMET